MASKLMSDLEGKGSTSFTDWLVTTGLGQFEAILKQVGIKDIASFSELDDDDLDEMKISDKKSRLALMSVAKYLNEKVRSSGCSKQAPYLMRLDSMQATSFTEQSDEVSIAIVGNTGSGKTNFAVQFISGKSILDHEATLIDSYKKEIEVDNTKCLVTLIDCGGDFGENLDVASTDGFIVCHKTNDMTSLNVALKLVDEIIAIKDTTTLSADTKWPIVLARTHHEQTESDSLLMLPEKYTNLNLCQYDLAIGEVSFTDLCIHQLVQKIHVHRKSYCKPFEVSSSEKRKALVGFWLLQPTYGNVSSLQSSEFPIMEFDKWGNLQWHSFNKQTSCSSDVEAGDNVLAVLSSSTGFTVNPTLSQITFNSEGESSISFLFAFDKDHHMVMQYIDDEVQSFKLLFNRLNGLPYPDLLPVSLSCYIGDDVSSQNGDVQLIATDGGKFHVHSAILNARSSAGNVKPPTSQEPYSSNVIKSFLVYLYTNAPPVSSAGLKSKYSPLLSDDELVQLSQLANQFGLTQLAEYCSPPQLQDTPSTTSQPSSVSEMLEKFGVDMDQVCYHIHVESNDLHQDLEDDYYSEKKKLGYILAAFLSGSDLRCAHQKVFLLLYHYHNTGKKLMLKSQRRAFLSVTLEWFKDVVDRYFKFYMDSVKKFSAIWNDPATQQSALKSITSSINYMKEQSSDVYSKHVDFVWKSLYKFLDATLRSKPKSLVQIGRNIPKILKIRRTIKTLQQLKNNLPFLAAEVTKELEFIADNYTDPRADARCKEFITAILEFVESKHDLISGFKQRLDNMSLKEWKAFVSRCGGKLNFFVNNLKAMEFSHADQFCMSSDTCRPKKLGRVCGVDMAWELGLLTQKPELEFPEAHKDYVKDMKKYLKEDNELYQQFNKYQNLISEAFGNYKPKQLKDQHTGASSASSSGVALIPSVGLGIELQSLLEPNCPVTHDIQFQLDDGSLLGAHSVVVCARCSWFMNALESGMKESVDRKIPLPGVSPDTAEAFVFVLYTGSLPEDIQCQPLDHVEVLAEMMSLSHRLELYDLFSVCEAKLVFCISEENAVSLLTYADVLQAQLLYGKCVQFITGHPSLQMSEEFKHLSLKTRTFLEAEYARASNNGRQSPQHLAEQLKPFYFKQMSRCELHNITQVTSVAQLQTKKDEVEKTVPSDTTDKVSIQAILKDLRQRAKVARKALD